jgi:hypothetical protein
MPLVSIGTGAAITASSRGETTWGLERKGVERKDGLGREDGLGRRLFIYRKTFPRRERW